MSLVDDIIDSLPSSNYANGSHLICTACGKRVHHTQIYVPPDAWDYRELKLCDDCYNEMVDLSYLWLKSKGIARLPKPEEFRDDGLPF